MTSQDNSLSHHKDEALLMSRTPKSHSAINFADGFIEKTFIKWNCNLISSGEKIRISEHNYGKQKW